MPEAAALAASIEQAVTGPVWHGSALAELLAPISAKDAVAHPIEGVHSIWELVLHIASWAAIAESRLSLEPTDEPDDNLDWPPVTRPTPTGWKQAREHLATAHESLATAVRALDPLELSRRVPGRPYSVRTMLHGVVEHGAYHGGQIAILAKAESTRPAS